MNYTYFIIALIFPLVVNWIAGLLQTESKVTSDLANFVTGWIKTSHTIIHFLMGIVLLSPLYEKVGWLGEGVSFQMFYEYQWIVTTTIIVNFFLSFVPHFAARAYSRKKFGSSRPDYDNWDEYDRRANRTGRTVVINHHHWWPFRSTSKPSLSTRRSSRSSSSGKGGRSSSSSTGGRITSQATGGRRSSSFAAVPVPIFSRGSSSRGSRSSSSKKSSGSGGGAGGGILAFLYALVKFLVQVLIFVGMLLLTALVAFVSYKVNDFVMDLADETYVL